MLSSCPGLLMTRIDDIVESLQSSLQVFVDALTPPIMPLAPRAIFFLLGYLASSIYLLEHAAWSAHQRPKEEHDTDVETLVKWVREGGLTKAKEDVLMIRRTDEGERRRFNERLLYGARTKL
jgi:hypothetical protein